MFLVCRPLRFSPSSAAASLASRVSSPGVGTSERVRREPALEDPFICLLVAFSGETDGMGHRNFYRARVLLTSPVHQIPVFLFVPSPPPLLACPALTRVTRSVLFLRPAGL